MIDLLATARAYLAGTGDPPDRHELAAEVVRLAELAERRRQERADALNVHSREGMLSSEWLLRTGVAERERDEARAAHADAAEMLAEVATERDRLAAKLHVYETNHGAHCDAEQERYATIAESACRILGQIADALDEAAPAQAAELRTFLSLPCHEVPGLHARAEQAERERDEARDDARWQFELGETYLASWFEAIDLCVARDAAIDAHAARIAEVMCERDEARAALAEARCEVLRALLLWTMERHEAEVAHRPIENVHRRTLDGTWKQVARKIESMLAAGAPARPPLDPAHVETLRVMLANTRRVVAIKERALASERYHPDVVSDQRAAIDDIKREIAALEAVLGEVKP